LTWACRWIYHWFCEAVSVWHQIYDYFLSHRASLL